MFHTDRMAAHDGKAMLPFDQPAAFAEYSQNVVLPLSRGVSCAVLPSDPGERGGSARIQSHRTGLAILVPWVLRMIARTCLKQQRSAGSGEISKQAVNDDRRTAEEDDTMFLAWGVRCVLCAGWPPLLLLLLLLRMMWDNSYLLFAKPLNSRLFARPMA